MPQSTPSIVLHRIHPCDYFEGRWPAAGSASDRPRSREPNRPESFPAPGRGIAVASPSNWTPPDPPGSFPAPSRTSDWPRARLRLPGLRRPIGGAADLRPPRWPSRACLLPPLTGALSFWRFRRVSWGAWGDHRPLRRWSIGLGARPQPRVSFLPSGLPVRFRPFHPESLFDFALALRTAH